MFKVAITGIFGSGKTTVSDIVKSQGYKVISCDDIVDDILKKERVITKIKKTFGEKIIRQGKIHRKKLADIIFHCRQSKKKLEKIIHPLVFKKLEKLILDYEEKKGIIFAEVPLLFETNSNNLFDTIIVVTARRNVIMQRLGKKKSKEDIELIWKNQISLQKKEKQADFIVDNSGSFKDTRYQVKKILETINLLCIPEANSM
jgi:dephospho-CoA kinase